MTTDSHEKEIIKKIKKYSNLTVRKKITINVLLVFVFIFFMFPIFWTLMVSFKTQSQIASMPPDVFSSFTLDNYKDIFNIGDYSDNEARNQLNAGRSIRFYKSIINTILLSLCSVAIALIIGVPAAYGLARFKSKIKDQLAFFFLSFKFFPELVFLIPLFLIFQKTHLYGTYFGLIWVYTLISLPLIIWIVRINFLELPYDLEQAAMLDGYSKRKIFFKIILPLAKPGIAAATVLAFIYAWNNFILALILATTKIQPVTVSILSQIDIRDLNYGRIAAAIIIAILPVIAVSQIASKYLVSGLSMGAVKQ